MELHDLPKYSEDWHWVASIHGLEVLDVSFMDINNEHLDSSPLSHRERIHVDGQKAACTNLSAGGAGNILSNLPEYMSEKVIRLLFGVVISNLHGCILDCAYKEQNNFLYCSSKTVSNGNKFM